MVIDCETMASVKVQSETIRSVSFFVSHCDVPVDFFFFLHTHTTPNSFHSNLISCFWHYEPRSWHKHALPITAHMILWASKTLCTMIGKYLKMSKFWKEPCDTVAAWRSAVLSQEGRKSPQGRMIIAHLVLKSLTVISLRRQEQNSWLLCDHNYSDWAMETLKGRSSLLWWRLNSAISGQHFALLPIKWVTITPSLLQGRFWTACWEVCFKFKIKLILKKGHSIINWRWLIVNITQTGGNCW